MSKDASVELGLRLTASRDGVLTAVRYYKSKKASNTTPASASVWSADGSRLAQVAISRTKHTGWRTVKLKSGVKLEAGKTYVISIYAKTGYYIASRNYFTSSFSTSAFSLSAGAGVYAYANESSFPTGVYRASNYWLDATFSPSTKAAGVPTSPTPTVTSTPSPSATASAPSASATAPTATVTASPTATAPTATTTATPTATAPTATTTATPTATATAASGLMGWQLNSSNVGLAPFGLKCDDLPLYTGSLRPAAGTHIVGQRIVGSLDLRNGDIVVERSCIRPAAGDSSSLVTNYVCGADDCPVISDKSIVIRDSEFDASGVAASQIAGSCAFRGTGTLQRNYMHGMGSGICFYGTGMKLEAIAEQNYVTDLRSYGESHNEAATIRDFMLDQNPSRVARFTQNRFNIAEGNVTAGLFIQPTWDDIDTLVVEGNLIEGGGYNLFLNAAHGTYKNVRSTNNRFRPTGWGPTTVQGGPGWATWSDNYLYDPSKTDAKGSVVQPS